MGSSRIKINGLRLTVACATLVGRKALRNIVLRNPIEMIETVETIKGQKAELLPTDIACNLRKSSLVTWLQLS
ncbi:hypothetical protein AC249_AIPGENE4107 [Exaiptasia diaphana]|nr:hypothetical protein AC249_AIPGENE4107 [Exaiptasia diaphana]